MDSQYDVIEPMKYDIEEYKHNFKYFDILELSNSFNFNIIPEQKEKKIIIQKTQNISFNIINNNINENNINENNLIEKDINILELKFRIIFNGKRFKSVLFASSPGRVLGRF